MTADSPLRPPEPLSAGDLKTYGYWAERGRQFFTDYCAAQPSGTAIAEPMQYIRHLAHATARLLSAHAAQAARIAELEGDLATAQHVYATESQRLTAEAARLRSGIERAVSSLVQTKASKMAPSETEAVHYAIGALRDVCPSTPAGAGGQDG